MSTIIYGGLLARQVEYLRLKAEMELAKAEVASGIYAFGYGTPKPSPTKCPCCGSREFRTHHETTICAYCRCAA